MTAPFGEQPTRVETSPGGVGFIRTEASKDLPAVDGKRQEWLAKVGADISAALEPYINRPLNVDEFIEWKMRWDAVIDSFDTAALQEWDWPRACPWCGVTVPVGVPTVLVDGEHVCQECAQ